MLYAISISPFHLLVLSVLYGIETSKSRPFNNKSSNVSDSVCGVCALKGYQCERVGSRQI